jgi:hypothetical protein
VSALKISFGMRFGKSPQHEAPRWEHSFQRSMAIANITTFPQRSAFSCSTTIAPRFKRREVGSEFEELSGGVPGVRLHTKKRKGK